MQKPKDFSLEEIDEYQAMADELEKFFADLTIRQIGGIKDEGNVAATPEAENPPVGDKPEGEAAEKSAEENASKPAEVKYGKRILVPQFIEYDFKYLCESAKSIVPEPMWPDPDKEPLPPPVIH